MKGKISQCDSAFRGYFLRSPEGQSIACGLPRIKTLLICALVVLTFSLAPAVVYVNKNATGANNGNSWTDAYTTIQAGIDDADVMNEEV
jgi:hypothetical protein